MGFLGEDIENRRKNGKTRKIKAHFGRFFAVFGSFCEGIVTFWTVFSIFANFGKKFTFYEDISLNIKGET